MRKNFRPLTKRAVRFARSSARDYVVRRTNTESRRVPVRPARKFAVRLIDGVMTTVRNPSGFVTTRYGAQLS